MVTLYRDHRYYHDEDGLYTRQSARKPLSEPQRTAHLPSSMEALVFRYGTNDWGIARAMHPTYKHSSELVHWTMWSEAISPPQARARPLN
jgi:hypothetical protein